MSQHWSEPRDNAHKFISSHAVHKESFMAYVDSSTPKGKNTVCLHAVCRVINEGAHQHECACPSMPFGEARQRTGPATALLQKGHPASERKTTSTGTPRAATVRSAAAMTAAIADGRRRICGIELACKICYMHISTYLMS
eukprot:6173595-Pleurochrysis_carterae.AAC.3